MARGTASPREVRQLLRDLRDLGRVTAPPEFRVGVLVRTGLGDAYWRVETPLGATFVAYNPLGISAVLRAEDADAFVVAFQARFGRPVYAAAPPAPLVRAVTAQLRGEAGPRPRFDLRGLSEFEQAVLRKALEIPRGEVRPYGWIAREIGRPRAARAVGSALGRNPIPLLIPCHRVVRGDGRVGDYVFGPDAKRALLTSEGIVPEVLDALAAHGVRYWGSDTTRVYCLPTCRNARRITAPHRVPFGSVGEAAAAGYRPCRVCRPAPAS